MGTGFMEIESVHEDLYPASVREMRQKGFVNVLLEKITRSH